jgi:O-antigen/teichoic acid export membrane protein
VVPPSTPPSDVQRPTFKQFRIGAAKVGREAWLLFVGLSVVNASNYLFHVLISRRLGPEDYGDLGSVLAVMLVLSVPISAIQAAIAKQISQVRTTAGEEQAAVIWGASLRGSLRLALALSAVLLALTPVMTRFLHLDSWATWLFVGLYVLPAVAWPVLLGALQGMKRFGDLAWASAASALLRVVLGVALVDAGTGVPGAVAASVMAQLAGAAIALSLLARRGPLRLRVAARTGAFLKEVGPVLSGLAAMWAVIEVDLILARHYLPDVAAGEYAAAGLLARAVLFVPAAVSMIALPSLSEVSGRGPRAYRWLFSGTLVTATLAGLTALVLSIGGDAAIHLTFGSQFIGAAPVLAILSVAMIGMSVTNLMVFFHVAAGTKAYQMLWGVAGIEITLIALFHSSPLEIAMVVLWVSLLVAVGGFATARSVARFERPLAKLPRDIVVLGGVPSESPSPDLSVIIPSVDVGISLAPGLRLVDEAIGSSGHSYEIIVVSDGSAKGWERVLEDAPEPWTVVHYEDRRGKGMALRVGMTRATGRYVAFIDSDGELDPVQFGNFLSIMELYDPDLVIGSKRHPLSRVSYPPARRLMSLAYQVLCRLLFGLNVRDTQTGMKLIRRDVLEAVLPRLLEKRFAFDLEFLVVARQLGFKRVFEAPVNLEHKFESTVDAGAVARILLDTAAIFYRRYVLQYYSSSPFGVEPQTRSTQTGVSSSP